MSTAVEIYNKAKRNGITFETDCTSVSLTRWEELMKGATQADKNIVNKLIQKNTDGEFENFINFHNPYDHYKTKTHIIFVHSAIEHFFKIND